MKMCHENALVDVYFSKYSKYLLENRNVRALCLTISVCMCVGQFFELAALVKRDEHTHTDACACALLIVIFNC